VDTAIVTMPRGFIRDLAVARSRQQVLAATARWLPEVMDVERASVALPTSDPGSLEIYALNEELITPAGTKLPIEGPRSRRPWCTAVAHSAP